MSQLNCSHCLKKLGSSELGGYECHNCWEIRHRLSHTSFEALRNMLQMIGKWEAFLKWLNK
jgi:hypothetical protein